MNAFTSRRTFLKAASVSSAIFGSSAVPLLSQETRKSPTIVACRRR